MISTYLYRNPRLLALVFVIILTVGLSAAYVLPRMEDPVLTRRVALVTVTFPGADAQRVESLVTEPLEQKLQEIQEVKEVISVSRASSSTVVVELRDTVVDVGPVWSQVRDRLADVANDLPADASRPSFRQLELKAYAAIVALKWNRAGSANYAILRRLAEDLKRTIQAIPGTESADLFGDPGEEVLVEVEPAVLASLGLTLGEVSGQIQSTDAKQSGGLLRGGQSELPIEIDEEIDSLKRLGETAIAYGKEGRFVPLAEIATISKGTPQPPSTRALVDAMPAVVVGAFVRDEQRIDHWTRQLDAALATFESGLSEGVEVDVILRQNTYVQDRLQRLIGNLILGTAAVVTVVFLLMGWRSMIVVGVALPLSALMVLGGMRAFAIPIHQMSITGLIIALGLLIDNAIVIVDEVRSRMRSGLNPIQAIEDGVRHLKMPLLGSTMTTALAFAPIALLPGPSGEFVRAIGISVIIAISSSFLLAMTVVPALTGLLQSYSRREDFAAHRPAFWRTGFSNRAMKWAYQRSLQMVFRFPVLGIGLGLVLPVLGFLGARTLPEQFFPASNRDQIQIEIELASSSPLLETEEVAGRVREAALAHDGVARVHWFIGQSAPTFFYNLMPQRFDTSFYAQAIVQLNPGVEPRDVIHKLQRDLDAEFARCRVLVRQLEQGPPFDAPVEVRLFGPELEELQDLGSQIRLLLSQTSDVLHTRSDLEESPPKLAVRVDSTDAMMAGLNELEIARQLYTSVEGLVGGSLLEGSEELPVRVRFSDRSRGSLEQISTLELQSRAARGSGASGSPPLWALAQLNVSSDVATIPRIDGLRMNEVKAYITAGTLPAEVISEFEDRLSQSGFRLPPGYRMEYGGEAAKRDEAVQNLLADVSVLVALIVATLFISFKSFRVSMIIAAVGGLSIGLGLFGLWSFGYPFGFMAILGTMGLVGVAINDAIVVMAGILEHPSARSGDREAMREVVVARTRHVVATSLTTMAGFTPLVLAGGGFWPPLAIAIAGGVAGATILALYFVPALYLIMRTQPKTAGELR